MTRKTLKSMEPLFVFEMANNHMGSLEHGLKILRRIHEAVMAYPFHFGFKLQYRDLDTFIHPDFRDRKDLKYVKRFSETRLTADEFQRLHDEMVRLGFVTICTPFDEASVDLIEKHDYDVIKIASCSFTDWPLLERIVKTKKPIIASTAGIDLEDVDKVVSFFEHRQKDFALLHCVASYPTPENGLELNQIDLFRQRYPKVRIGYSTHEEPDNVESIKIAVAKGATVFEKHVGIPGESGPLNAYSATPDQVGRWLAAAQKAYGMCGATSGRSAFRGDELQSLQSLRRGAYARVPLPNGRKVDTAQVFFAMPTTDGQITANDMSKYTTFIPTEPVPAGAPLMMDKMTRIEQRDKIYGIVNRVKTFLQEAHAVVPPQVDLEISHHYGIDRFEEYGLTMMTVVNRDYCKKLIVLLPGQKHPEQYHRQKEETFHILHGEATIALDGQSKAYRKGDVVVVERGVKHRFETVGGVIIEEISSTHQANDSFYTDPVIAKNEDRKTLMTYWLE